MATVDVCWIGPTPKDKEGLVDRRHNFQGWALGANPIPIYDQKLSQSSGLPTSLRGIYEFDVKTRSEGEASQLSIQIPIPFIKTSDRAHKITPLLDAGGNSLL